MLERGSNEKVIKTGCFLYLICVPIFSSCYYLGLTDIKKLFCMWLLRHRGQARPLRFPHSLQVSLLADALLTQFSFHCPIANPLLSCMNTAHLPGDSPITSTLASFDHVVHSHTLLVLYCERHLLFSPSQDHGVSREPRQPLAETDA